ncbi:MAG: metallopeptidase family protein [Chloroflexi bacterium]|nr:metallopeptidase family protein [Chloroflexota bacterium]
MLDNVDVTVQDYPTRAQLGRTRPGMTLLGLYEGVPQIERTRGYSMVPPDKITLFQKPIEYKCHSDKEIAAEIRRVLQHEIAHHFGFDEQSLRRIESRGRGRKDR